MSIINDDQIAYMREAQRDLLPDVATIEIVASAPDGYGGETQTWTVVPGTVPARIGEVPPTLPRELAGELGVGATTVVTLPAGTGIKIGDRLVVGGRRYEVRGVSVPSSMATATRAEVRPL